MQFNKEVCPIDAGSSSSHDLRGLGADGIYGTGDDRVYQLAASYAFANRTLILTVKSGDLPAGVYRLKIAGIHDDCGNVLDGGDGVAGGAFARVFTVAPLQGDVTGDRVVNDLDLFKLWKEPKKPAAQRNLAFDLNGDGQVTTLDLDLVKANYLSGSPAPQPPAPAGTNALHNPAAVSDETVSKVAPNIASAANLVAFTPWWQDPAKALRPVQGFALAVDETLEKSAVRSLRRVVLTAFQ